MCRHRVQFYDDEKFLLDRAGGFLASALLAPEGGAAVAVATAPRLQRLRAWLERSEAAAALDRLVCLDAERTLAQVMTSDDGLPDAGRLAALVDPLLDALCRGGRRVGVFGEMVALLYARGNEAAALRLEQLWDDAVRRHGIDVLCAYPTSAFAGHDHRRAFEAVCDAHAVVEAPECIADGDPHRVAARLRQRADSLPRELARRRRSDRLLAHRAARISALKRSRAALRTLAGEDGLTGLANRRAFDECLARALARARRTGGGVALLFVDIDDFKGVNDRFGHAAGDLLLKQAAERLRRCVRGADTACRLAGDEFTVVLEDAAAGDAELLAARIAQAFDAGFQVGARTIGLTASVGSALHPGDGADAQALLRSADRAMYRAKALGKGRHVAARQPPPPSPAAGEAIDPRPRADFMTAHDAALRLELSLPHVVKLIAERRFADVLPQRGGLPLIPAEEVGRVARELGLTAEDVAAE